MEGPAKIHNSGANPLKQREMMREELFQQLIASTILDHWHDELDEADIPEEAIEQAVNAFAGLSEANKLRVLAVPAQLRPSLFSRYAEQIRKGSITGAGMVVDLLEKAIRHDFTIGYHLSPREIKPDKDGSWVVRGTEKDHRHDDRPMAYYSMDYAHSYKKKNMQYLYVVRAERGESSGHYQDNDGTWGHASTLSIIDMLDLREIEEELNRRMKAIEGNGKGG